jgi:hypothetical protein
MPSPFGNFDSGNISGGGTAGRGVGARGFGGVGRPRMRNPDGSLQQGYINPHGQMPPGMNPPMQTDSGGGRMSSLFGSSRGGNIPLMNRNSDNSVGGNGLGRFMGVGRGVSASGSPHGPGAMYGAPSASDSYARQAFEDMMNGRPQRGGSGIAAGDFLSEGYARDYENMDNAMGSQRGDLANLSNSVQQGTAMGYGGIGMAEQNARQGNQVAREGLNELRDQGRQSNAVYNRARQSINASNTNARADMQKGIDTKQSAIDQHDFFRKDSVAGGMSAIDSQFASARQQIQSSQMDPAEKQVELDNLNRVMNQQRSAFAANADSEAANTLLAARGDLANSQMSMGSTLGGLAQQGASIAGGLGMQASQDNQRALMAGYQMMQQQSQFNGSLSNSALAAAMQAQTNNDRTRLAIIQENPYGAPQLADTILAMMNAQNMRPGSETSQRFGGRMQGLLGQQQRRPTFTGYA